MNQTMIARRRAGRLLSIILALALSLGVLVAAPAAVLAAPELSMQINVSPTSLVSGGTVELEVTVSNSGDEEAQNVTLTYNGDVLSDMGNIPAGDSKSYTEPSFSVPEDKLGEGMKLVVNYEYGDRSDSISQTVKVDKKEANVSVKTDVKTDKTTVAKGGEVVFTFAIENQGDVAIEGAELKASALNSGNSIGGSFDLAANDAKVINYTATVYKNIKVEPVLTYKAAGKSHSQKLDTTEITVSEAGASISATVDKNSLAAGEQATFTISISNTGSAALKGLTLSDGANGSVPLPQNTIGAGESLTATYTVSPTADTSYTFSLTAQDDSGQTFTFTSNSVDIKAAAAPSPSPSASLDPSAALTMSVEVSPTKLEAAGDVKVTVKIDNNTTQVLKNMKISEKSLGVIETIEEFPPGEATYTSDITLIQTVTCVLTATAQTQDGQTLTATSEPIEITVGSEAGGFTLSPIVIIIGVVILLIIAVIIVLLVLMNKEKKKKALIAQQEQLRASRVAMRQDGRHAPPPAGQHAQPGREPQDMGDEPDYDEEYDDELEGEPEPQESDPSHRWLDEDEPEQERAPRQPERRAPQPERRAPQQPERRAPERRAPETARVPREDAARRPAKKKHSDFEDRSNF